MGLRDIFTTPKQIEIEGVIDRIGVSQVNDSVLVYAFTLKGHEEPFETSLLQKDKNRMQVALARPGDRIRLTKDEGKSRRANRFVNLDL